MAVCVTGMHRSGTSMVMSILARAGLHVGDERDLMPGNASNPEGHWENIHVVDLNDAVLSAIGGAWDFPPAGPVPIPYPNGTAWAALRQQAIRVQHELSQTSPWGFKDPRASLVAPFWLDVLPDLRFVICLRSPLDVACSLRRRAHTSYELGLSLWQAYNERVLASIPADRRIVTHYSAFFERPGEEIRRICRFAGLEPDGRALEEACQTIKRERGNGGSGVVRLEAAGLSRVVLRLYQSMCDEAGWREPSLAGSTPPATRVNSPLLELETARRQVFQLASALEVRERELEARDRDLALAMMPRTEETVTERMAEQVRMLFESVPANREQLDQAMGHLRDVLDVVSGLAESTAALVRASEYERLVRHIRHSVERATPPGSTIAVISKGDPDLIDFRDRRGVHFPYQESGAPAPHPRDSADALERVSEIAHRGARFLAVPFWSFWWLETYPEFGKYVSLGTLSREDVCVICRVSEAAAYRTKRAVSDATERRQATEGTRSKVKV